MSFKNYVVPYAVDERYSKKVAYFSMEFAIHQHLKVYSGGLGFLAGSHLRSAYELRQDGRKRGYLYFMKMPHKIVLMALFAFTRQNSFAFQAPADNRLFSAADTAFIPKEIED